MNILYISPYRDNSLHSLSAVNHIGALSAKCRLHIQPVYMSKQSNKIDESVMDLENQPLLDKPYDAVVQHAPIDYLLPFDMVGIKNLCIPIIKYIKNLDKKHKHQRILSQFDKILVDSDYDATFIKTHYNINQKQVKLINYTQIVTNDPALNLSYHKNHYKFYTFIDKYTIYSAYQIILAFILMGNKIHNSSLLLVINDDALLSNISEKLEFLIQKTNVKYIKNAIKIISLNKTAYNSIHDIGDCCIDIRNTSNASIHTNIAKLYDNSIINNENINIYDEPIIDEPGYEYGSLYQHIDVNDLCNKMRTVINTTPIYKSNTIPTIDNVICK